MHPAPAQNLVGFPLRPRTVLHRWRAWRITGLLPGLMQEFHDDRPPLEVLDCADAVVAYYEERSGCTPSLGMARRRTRECLRGGVCEGVDAGPDPSPPMEASIQASAVTGSPLMSLGNLIPT
jgi:hypothetical protein